MGSGSTQLLCVYPTQDTGQRWLARLIQKLWEIAWDFWRHRHIALTAADSPARLLQRQQADETIQQAYAMYSLEPSPHLRLWFSKLLPSILAESLDFKQQWIQMLSSLTQGTT